MVLIKVAIPCSSKQRDSSYRQAVRPQDYVSFGAATTRLLCLSTLELGKRPNVLGRGADDWRIQ